jgi:hypothetical protein
MKKRVKNGWNVYFDKWKVLVEVDRLVIPFPGCGRIDGHERNGTNTDRRPS